MAAKLMNEESKSQTTTHTQDDRPYLSRLDVNTFTSYPEFIKAMCQSLEKHKNNSPSGIKAPFLSFCCNFIKVSLSNFTSGTKNFVIKQLEDDFELINEDGDFELGHREALLLITFRFIDKLTASKESLMNRENFGYYEIYYELLHCLTDIKRYDAGLEEPSDMKLKPFFESLSQLEDYHYDWFARVKNGSQQFKALDFHLKSQMNPAELFVQDLVKKVHGML